MKSYSPLRYPGGKGQFYNKVEEIIKLNSLDGCVYVEPFAGGSGVALRLLFEKKVKRIVINDYDYHIYAFWKSILEFNEEFCEKINTTTIDMTEWYNQKAIFNNPENYTIFEVGFSTFFLNRTNRSGILKAGPIGGKNQEGNYLIDCRFNKEKLIELIKKIGTYRKHIQVHNLDAVQFLNRFKNVKPNKYFIFLDPPYYKKGKELYVNFLVLDDHKKIYEAIKTNLDDQYWIVTYDNCSEIKDIYSDKIQVEFQLNYSVEKKRVATELLVTTHMLKLPDFN